jgi:putative methionine-R-sulfoxide reductase with GAF domain
MRRVVDALWDLTSSRGVSWIGFYTKHPRRDEMILGPRRDKPACSPLGLQGMCGRCWAERKPIVVADVATLGKNYIACDPKDRSEAVIPLFEADGTCYGVLDADSYETGAFGTADIIGMTVLVEHAGLSAPQQPVPEILRL